MAITSNTPDYADRRKALIKAIKKQYPELQHVAVLLFAGFERDRNSFRQESFFTYFTGMQEPSVAVMFDSNENYTLFVPSYGTRRDQWVISCVPTNREGAARYGFTEYKDMGEPVRGYQMHFPVDKSAYKNLLHYLENLLMQGVMMYTVTSHDSVDALQHHALQELFDGWLPNFELIDATPLAARLRRKKDASELAYMTHAIDITHKAQEAALKIMRDGAQENQVCAAIEHTFIAASTRASFPSIVATGKNGTVLHYVDGSAVVKNGDLVVIDIGAEYQGYAADITRTYPVSGKFDKRQRELYSIVLATQQHIADKAQPGYWLSNKDEPQYSLNHMARAYLDQEGYGAYFPHGIGHFLGLEVHDVGDSSEPLQEGDVITIEPGIYISEEGIGIRIEDDYLITETGSQCLSSAIPKDPDAVEAWICNVRQKD